jgi:hypothetical protein
LITKIDQSNQKDRFRHAVNTDTFLFKRQGHTDLERLAYRVARMRGAGFVSEEAAAW